MTPNFPETDLQFMARMLLRVREGQQIPVVDDRRLREIARTGTSNSMPPADPALGTRDATVLEQAQTSGATRVGPETTGI